MTSPNQAITNQAITNQARTSGGVTIGVTGQRWRATVTPWGDIEPWDADAPAVRWFVAADDRWYVPADETAVRQRRLEGVPVIETRLRVPDGDAVHRVWSVADHGGLTVIEIENESSRPFAVAITGGALLTERAPADVPIQGIDLPGDAVVVPVGHRSTARIAFSHVASSGRGALPARLAPSTAVVSGWITVCDRASRLVLPAAGLVEAVMAARCDLLLDGPIDARVDPIGFLFDVAQLARLGEDADGWLPEIVEPVARIARDTDPAVDDVLDGLERLALIAADDRAANDLAALRSQRAGDGIGREHTPRRAASAAPSAATSRSLGEFVDTVERSVVCGGDLLAGGFPPAWLGSNFEVHGVPTSPRSAVSFAVRWHGDRPALLWEQSGDPVTLAAPAVDPTWSTTLRQGEALWPSQAGVEMPVQTPGVLASSPPSAESVSFG